MLHDALLILVLAYCQQIGGSMSSRSRNRNSHAYHGLCAVLSNGFFLATMTVLNFADWNPWMGVPYVAGAVVGSITGSAISMRIEKLIGATT